MKNKKINELREKILKGLELSYEKLLQVKRKNNGELVFSKDEKIVIVKAADISK
jgi:adenylate cyclase